ncbi:Y-family DNA polymerase [Flavisolibacter ginsengisoli]|jgi:DNA polymerase V|uniref:DNA polymerase V n=1 Tax=Flavisolibacter ginsengisoli DSM 18119 TaxID=1121884 RepID=A0A1M4UHC2_9BACT|nr:Y-family DNA polymerase [Flavisolibacter ginsengisoli]SHE56097.1 DNA polymerase V [Flavisolibacter ginsengisoli DSM 18119]
MIALIDCNNFYCSCERVFNPGLLGRALIVLSNNDGCAISRSEEAKELGIQMAQPAFMIDELIKKEEVNVFSSNYTLYDDMSRRVMQVIKELVPRAEVYSVDEIFADLSGMKYKDLEELGSEIKDMVGRCTGIPVTVGIAPTKTLAKMANRYAKKNRPGEGVFSADTKELVEMLLSATKIGDVWGIGKQFEALLSGKGFVTALDLVNRAPEEWIRKEMSVVGQRLFHELKGINCIPWEETTKVRKNICTSRSFGKLITRKNEVAQSIAKFTSSCGEKLRKEKTCARRVHVFLQTNPHRPQDPQYFQSITLELEMATNLTTLLLKHAMKALDMIFREGYNYQKAGVMMLDLIPQKEVQLGLFETLTYEKDQKLMEKVDELNKVFGKDVVRFGVQDYGQNWKLKQGNLSGAYTTRLHQVIKAS